MIQPGSQLLTRSTANALVIEFDVFIIIQQKYNSVINVSLFLPKSTREKDTIIQGPRLNVFLFTIFSSIRRVLLHLPSRGSSEVY